MKTRLVIFIIIIFAFVSSTDAKSKVAGPEKKLQDEITALSDKYKSEVDFEKAYRTYYRKAAAIHASRKTYFLLLHQRMMFFYYTINPDSVKYYAQILTDYYQKSRDMYNYYFTQAIWADVNTSKGRISEALNVGNMMMKEATQHREKIGIAYGAYSLAIAYFSMNYHKKAITYFKQAIPIFYQEKRWSVFGVATCNYIGSLTSLKEYKKAERVMFKLDSLITASEKAGQHLFKPYLLCNLKGIIAPQLYCYLKQPRKVRHYLNETIRLYHKYPTLPRLPLLQAHLQDATASKNYRKEIDYADSLLNYYGDDVSNGYRMHDFKSKAYEGLGNYKTALAQLKRYNELKDSVYGDEALNQVTQFSAAYGVDRLTIEKAELALQMKEKQAHSFLIIIIVVILLFVTIALFSVYLLHANRRQKKMIAIKDDFIRNVSHEIRTPLNYIVGFSDVIASSVQDDESMKGMVKNIHQGSDELLKMFDDIIILSDNESGGRLPKFEEVDVNELCREAMNRVRGLMKEQTEQMCVLSESPVIIHTDKMKLQYVIYNLLHNAAKFTAKGVVRISVEKTDDKCFIRVSDTGKGIKPESRGQLFNSFFKEDKFTQGLGLGLTNARNALKLIGGTLTLNENYQGGTEFVICINESKIK
jgi:signal transduction histidine kinase